MTTVVLVIRDPKKDPPVRLESLVVDANLTDVSIRDKIQDKIKEIYGSKGPGITIKKISNKGIYCN
jgi:hypothetical protein